MLFLTSWVHWMYFKPIFFLKSFLYYYFYYSTQAQAPALQSVSSTSFVCCLQGIWTMRLCRHCWPNWGLSWSLSCHPGLVAVWVGKGITLNSQLYHPTTHNPHSTLRVVVAVDGFWVGVFVFSFLFTNSYQPNFEIPIEHMKRLYSCSNINIRQYTFKLDSTYLNQKDQIINVVFFLQN